MAILTHSTLPNASVHEPKHITANGVSSSGSVITNSSSTTATSEYRRLKQADVDELEVLWQVQEFDGSAAAQTHYIPATFNGDIINIDGIVNIAVAGGTNSYKMQIDGVDVAGSAHSFTITAGTGGTAGDVISATPTSAQSFSDGSVITIVNTAKANTEAALDIRWIITCKRT